MEAGYLIEEIIFGNSKKEFWYVKNIDIIFD
jgi:hypothetical protein